MQLIEGWWVVEVDAAVLDWEILGLWKSEVFLELLWDDGLDSFQ